MLLPKQFRYIRSYNADAETCSAYLRRFHKSVINFWLIEGYVICYLETK